MKCNSINKRPNFNPLGEEILVLRKDFVIKYFDGVAAASTEVVVQKQRKPSLLWAPTEPNRFFISVLELFTLPAPVGESRCLSILEGEENGVTISKEAESRSPCFVAQSAKDVATCILYHKDGLIPIFDSVEEGNQTAAVFIHFVQSLPRTELHICWHLSHKIRDHHLVQDVTLLVFFRGESKNLRYLNNAWTSQRLLPLEVLHKVCLFLMTLVTGSAISTV